MQKKVNHLIYRQSLLKACLVACAFYCPLTSNAQIDTTKKLKEVKIKSDQLPQIQTITPSQQISADEFERYSAFNVADAIKNFSGVILKDYGGIGGLKTISVRGLGANHTAILYDGVEVSDAENGQIDLGKLNLEGVQQISLYNGQPFNICQTASAFASASVLSITTIKPLFTGTKPYLITAGVKSGSFGLFNPYVQWQQRINKYWSFIINSYLENANGQYSYRSSTGNGKDSVHTRTNADITAQQLDGGLYWAKSDSNKFNLHINYYNSNRGLPGEVILYNPTYSADRLWDRDLFIQAGYERIWKNGLHLLVNTKVSQNYTRYLNPTFLNTEGRLDQKFTQQEAYQSVAISYLLFKNWEIAYSTDLFINNLNEDFNYPTTFAKPTRFTFLNVLSSNFKLGKLQLQGSLLKTNISETVKVGSPSPGLNVLSPTIVASVQPFNNSNFQARAFYKSIFRNPTFNDLYYGGIGNPNLKPEYARQFDLGLTYTKALNGIFSYVALSADAYYDRVINKIVFIPRDGFNGSIQNFGKVDIEGLDVTMKTRARFSNACSFSLAINYSYLLALNITESTSSIYLNQLPYTPKNTFAVNGGIDYKHFGLYYNQVISSSRYYANDNISADYLPEYSISDLSLTYRFLTKNSPVKASFELNNLFNKNYVVVESYPMPGRSVRLSIQITI